MLTCWCKQLKLHCCCFHKNFLSLQSPTGQRLLQTHSVHVENVCVQVVKRRTWATINYNIGEIMINTQCVLRSVLLKALSDYMGIMVYYRSVSETGFQKIILTMRSMTYINIYGQISSQSIYLTTNLHLHRLKCTYQYYRSKIIRLFNQCMVPSTSSAYPFLLSFKISQSFAHLGRIKWALLHTSTFTRALGV